MKNVEEVKDPVGHVYMSLDTEVVCPDCRVVFRHEKFIEIEEGETPQDIHGRRRVLRLSICGCINIFLRRDGITKWTRVEKTILVSGNYYKESELKKAIEELEPLFMVNEKR